jgi:hypothetical protein
MDLGPVIPILVALFGVAAVAVEIYVLVLIIRVLQRADDVLYRAGYYLTLITRRESEHHLD